MKNRDIIPNIDIEMYIRNCISAREKAEQAIDPLLKEEYLADCGNFRRAIIRPINDMIQMSRLMLRSDPQLYTQVWDPEGKCALTFVYGGILAAFVLEGPPDNEKGIAALVRFWKEDLPAATHQLLSQKVP